jgi:molybdopterin molybdotransferase
LLEEPLRADKMYEMISVKMAKELVAQYSYLQTSIKIRLEDSANHVLAEDIYALRDIPGFHQSAMDGYALRIDDYNMKNKLTIKGESAAGIPNHYNLGPGEAFRIFTGAPIPVGADTIVIQENVTIQNDQLIINDKLLQKGSNVRPMGSEIKANTLAIKKGSLLTPAAIGYLAGIGMHEVSAYSSPIIHLIVTGNELTKPGTKLQFGQVYESNSYTISAALQQMGLKLFSLTQIEDEYEKIVNTILNKLNDSEILLITGGISVGDYDYISKALKSCGVEQVFHGIKQKPGKPLFFGCKGKNLIFGLPGNPSSVLTCFYEYVYPCIRTMMGFTQTNLPKKTLPLRILYQKKSGLTHFVKASCTAQDVTPLHAQESYRMQSFAVSNCLICLEEEKEFFQEGDLVEVHLIPY